MIVSILLPQNGGVMGLELDRKGEIEGGFWKLWGVLDELWCNVWIILRNFDLGDVEKERQ